MKRSVCFYCNLVLAEAEPRVTYEGKDYHPDCDKTRQRQKRIRDFLTMERGKVTLHIVPHHPHGR